MDRLTGGSTATSLGSAGTYGVTSISMRPPNPTEGGKCQGNVTVSLPTHTVSFCCWRSHLTSKTRALTGRTFETLSWRATRFCLSFPSALPRLKKKKISFPVLVLFLSCSELKTQYTLNQCSEYLPLITSCFNWVPVKLPSAFRGLSSADS